MGWNCDGQQIEELIEQLEEWSAIASMANLLAQQIPAGVSKDVEATAGPIELWRVGIGMAALSLETRQEIMRTLSQLIVILRELLEGGGASQRRGMLRLAPMPVAGGA